MTERRGDWMQTFTGKVFYPLDPRPEDVDLVDIAHALSNICRFGGHTREHYSVAQHSVLVALHAPDGVRAEALMHDSAEYILYDFPRPIKMAVPEYVALEHRLEAVILGKYDLFDGFRRNKAAIKHQDNRALYTERRDLMGPAPLPWTDAQGPASEPWPDVIEPWDPRVAFGMFMWMAFGLGMGGSRFLTHAEIVVAEYWWARTLERIPASYDPGWPCMCGEWNAPGPRCWACDGLKPGTRLAGDTEPRTRFDLPGDTTSPTRGPYDLPNDRPSPTSRVVQPGFLLPTDGPKESR